MIAACEAAQIRELIAALPAAYDTRIGGTGADETGLRLSGSEARCLVFARALPRDAPIPLFDEPTLTADVPRSTLGARSSASRTICLHDFSVTDCCSVAVMRIAGIVRIADFDTHFEQMRFFAPNFAEVSQ